MKYICGCCKKEVKLWQRKIRGKFFGEKFAYHKGCMGNLCLRLHERVIREANGGREVE
jgi:hypothetical protein